jgi:hypothetical protein
MHSLPRRLRRATGLGAVAMLALPLAAQAADNRVQFSESFNSGVAGLRPTLTLRAVLDNGAGGAPVPTGVLRFTIDSRHLSSAAWSSLMAAPVGTQLGTVESDLSGPGASPMRVLSHGKDANGQYVRAGVDVPHSIAAIVGDDSLPVVIRRSPSGAHVSFQLDVRSIVGKLAAQGAPSTLQTVSFSLRSVIVYGGRGHPVTLNPSRDTALTNSVTARACAQPACATLLPTSSTGSATVHLPKTVTVAAPVAATYGYRYSIGGTGRSGDLVILQSLANTGLPARATAMVRPDGTFVIRATLRSLFSDDGDLTLAARGRYAVASIEGGNTTVYGIAAQDTHVVLARPRFVLQRKTGGKLLHFAVRIPGGDRHVRVAIKLGSETLAKGYANEHGNFFKTIVKPHARGNLRVVASVPGADTAISDATPLSR